MTWQKTTYATAAEFAKSLLFIHWEWRNDISGGRYLYSYNTYVNSQGMPACLYGPAAVYDDHGFDITLPHKTYHAAMGGYSYHRDRGRLKAERSE